MKISSKIYKLFIFVMFLVFILTNIIFLSISRTYLINETKNELMEDAKKMAHNITKNPRDFTPTTFRFKMMGRVLDSKKVVVDSNDKIVYTEILEGNTLEDKLKEHVYIKLKLDDNMFLYLATKTKGVLELNRLHIIALSISLTLGMIIGFVILKVFETKILMPINKLNKKMQTFDIKKEYKNDIKTNDEIEELDISFNNMIREIKRLDKQRKINFQNTSHEIKTPLMSIQGYAEGIKEDVVKDKNKALDIIIEESQRLKKTIDKFIYISKLDDLKEFYNFENSSINKVIQKSIDTASSISDINIIFNFEDEINLNIDKDKMKIVFDNILSNSMRYADTKITIDLKKIKEMVIIKISDDGKGFEPKTEEKIFDRFYKGKDGNTGIGLFIVKKILKNHNFDIKAYNENGAVFEITQLFQ